MVINNPLHGKFTESVGSQSVQNATIPSKDQGTVNMQSNIKESDLRWFKTLGSVLLVLVALYPIIHGVAELLSPKSLRANSRTNEVIQRVDHKITKNPTLFESLFCRGARRSSWCKYNNDKSNR